MNQNDFSFCRISVLNPWSVHWYCFPTQCETCKGRLFINAYLCLSSCSFSSSSLIFFFLMKLKSSKVRFAPPPLLAIILLKPRGASANAISLIAVTDAFASAANRVDIYGTHILLYLVGKITVLLPLFRFGFQRIIKLNRFISAIPCLEQT